MNRFEYIDSKMEAIAQSIVDRLEQGLQGNFEKPWIGGIPKNITGREYAGANILNLSFEATNNNRKHLIYLTFKQAKDLDISIYKGEKATTVFYKGFSIKDNETGKFLSSKQEDEVVEKIKSNLISKEEYKRKYTLITIPKSYNVFNIDQTNCQQVKPELYHKVTSLKNPNAQPFEENKLLEDMIKNNSWICPIVEGKSMAYFDNEQKIIVIPQKEQFINSERYYGVLLHEMSHSTKIVINRNIGNTTQEKAREELVAELSSALAGVRIGVQKHISEQNLLYVNSWLQQISKDKNYIKEVFNDVIKSSNFICEKLDVKNDIQLSTENHSKNIEQHYSLPKNKINSMSQYYQIEINGVEKKIRISDHEPNYSMDRFRGANDIEFYTHSADNKQLSVEDQITAYCENNDVDIKIFKDVLEDWNDQAMEKMFDKITQLENDKINKIYLEDSWYSFVKQYDIATQEYKMNLDNVNNNPYINDTEKIKEIENITNDYYNTIEHIKNEHIKNIKSYSQDIEFDLDNFNEWIKENIPQQNPNIINAKNLTEAQQFALVYEDASNLFSIGEPTDNFLNHVLFNQFMDETTGYSNNDVRIYLENIYKKRGRNYDDEVSKLCNQLLDEDQKIEVIKNDPWSIEIFNNPSEELQMLAVKSKPYSIQKIKNPTQKTIHLAKSTAIKKGLTNFEHYLPKTIKQANPVKPNFTRIPPEEITRIKQIPIADYLASKGFVPNNNPNHKDLFFSLHGEKTGHTHINTEKNTWYDFSNGKGGSIIDLEMQFSNCDFKTAVQNLGGQIQNLQTDKMRIPVQKIQDCFKIQDYRIFDLDTSKRNVLYVKGIDKNTLEHDNFKGAIKYGNKTHIKEGANNVIFPFKASPTDTEYKTLLMQLGQKVDLAKNGMLTDKMFAKGEEKRQSLWFSNPPKKVDYICVVENPVDALSHYQIYQPQNTLYVATGGRPADKQLDIIKNLGEQYKCKTALCFDNDFAGHTFDTLFLAKKTNELVKVEHIDGITNFVCNFSQTQHDIFKNCIEKNDVFSPSPMRKDNKTFFSCADGDIKGISLFNDVTKHFADVEDVSIQKSVSKDFNDDLIAKNFNPAIAKEFSITQKITNGIGV